MAEHNTLTGASLHECKGIAAATAGQVIVADGAGSATLKKITTAEIDTTSIFNTNKFFLMIQIPDVSTPDTVYLPIPCACTAGLITTTLDSAITVANAVLTFQNHSGSSMNGSLTITQSGSAAGDVDTHTVTTNNTFTAGQHMRIITDGGSTTAAVVTVVVEFTRTA